MFRALLAVAAALAASPACVPAFRCSEDARCDLAAGGRCVDGVCHYDAAGSSDAATSTTSAASTSNVSATSTASSGPGDTDAPAACEPLDLVLADAGKATGVALAADGGAYVVGVTDVAPTQLRAQRLAPDGDVVWNRELAGTHGGTLDDDTDVWARAFLADPAADELLVVYSLRTQTGMDPSVKRGPYVHRIATADGGSIDLRDELIASYRSIRGVAMPADNSLLFAGEREDNIWYQSATREGSAWTPAWPDPPSFFDATAGFKDPAIAQAVAPISSAVIVGGTWDREPDQDAYSAWLRRLSPATGDVACMCDVQGAGVMALAPAGDDAVFVAGFTQDDALSQLWVARVEAACPLACTPTWQDRVPGKLGDTYFYRPETLRDVAYALVPLPGGGVIVGGTVDKKPWAARYADDGARPWLMEDSEQVPTGAVLAAAVSPDERCLTLVGSENYLELQTRRWWVRRVQLPG